MLRSSQRHQQLARRISFFSLLISLVRAQCNTDQNPYCRGNKKLEQLCCPYPDVCYWANRNGDPACCPAGQICIDSGGQIVTPQPIETQPQETTTYDSPTQELSTITSYITHPDETTPVVPPVVITNTPEESPEVITTTEEPACDVCDTITSDAGEVFSTVTSDIAGAFSTVTSDVAGGIETVTSTLGAIATAAATGIVQVINAAPARPQPSYQIPVAAGIGVAVWQLM